MRQIRQPEHVFHGIHRQSDVGGVLAIGRRGEKLDQIHRAAHQLAAVTGIDISRPVRVGAGEHQGAE